MLPVFHSLSDSPWRNSRVTSVYDKARFVRGTAVLRKRMAMFAAARLIGTVFGVTGTCGGWFLGSGLFTSAVFLIPPTSKAMRNARIPAIRTTTEVTFSRTGTRVTRLEARSGMDGTLAMQPG